MWPASALLTGNGVAFILRVPGHASTATGGACDGWWIFAGTAAVSLLSKYLIQLGGRHIFNPSNFGLVALLPRSSARTAPSRSTSGGGRCRPGSRSRSRSSSPAASRSSRGCTCCVIAVGFWLAFAAGIGVLALTGHAMTARWHLGPITGAYFWWVLVTSPEILVFLFFMITDPKTTPRRRRGARRLRRLASACSRRC